MMKNRPAELFFKFVIYHRFILGGLLVLLSIGLISFINRDLEVLAKQVVQALNLDVDNHYINLVLEKIAMVNRPMIVEASLGVLLYGILDLIEGYGLQRRKRWAEYLTVLAIGLFIPLEFYVVIQKQTLVRFGALGLNIAIVIFLIWHKGLFHKLPLV